MNRRVCLRAAAAAFGASAAACAWASTAAAASAPIPFEAEAPAASPSGLQWLLAIITCVVVLAVIVSALRRLGWPLRTPARAQANALAVTHRVHLAHTTQLVTVDYGNRRLLLAVSPTHTTCLRDDALAGPDEAPPQETPP
jgi:flagellar biogenesis protein FliO